jgi:hypothetical protein
MRRVPVDGLPSIKNKKKADAPSASVIKSDMKRMNNQT